MTTTKAKSTESTVDREIIITRVVTAPREMVWDAFTDPKQVVRWWGPVGFTTTIEEMDVRPGGVWKQVMRGPDGTEFPNKSVFKEVVKPERLVFSHSGGKKGAPELHFEMTWTFDAVEDGKTKVTIHQVYAAKADRDMVANVYGAIEGGNQTLARLDEELAKKPLTLERTFDAPIQKVWSALTEADQMKQWYFDNITTFKPEVGFETQVDVHHNDQVFPHLWKVTTVVPGKKIAYSWKYKGEPGDSEVTFELFDEKGKTRLKLTHAGLETFPAGAKFARGNFLKGWTMLIGSELKQFLCLSPS